MTPGANWTICPDNVGEQQTAIGGKVKILVPNRMKNKADEANIAVTFWGTRGTLPTPGALFQKAGGNTNCIEVQCGEHTIILDAGTGIRQLGSQIATSGYRQKIHLLLTHAHYDHVEGLPFFAPFFEPERKIDVYCGELDGSSGTKDTVLNLMRRPYFPVGPEVFAADVSYNNVQTGQSFVIGGEVKVRTCPLNHPGGATAYRIDYKGSSFACVTDTEHTPGKHDDTIINLIDGVDLFVYDCSLLDSELSEFQGYGHSTHEEGIRLCQLAGAGGIMATHHMPFRTDSELDSIQKNLYGSHTRSGIAREGDEIVLK